MAGKAVQVLLVTANVGSIFEDPSMMLKMWTEEFLQTVARLDPKFIAIHCQEVGGKNYERSMKHVEYFVRLLMTSEELRLFDKVRVYLDEDFSSAENFTALGNFYFVHETVSDALIWDFAAMNFVSASGKEVHSGNIEAVTTKEKAKFPQDFFPECKWSRKGFLRTRWSLNGTVFDLINIHLFHDASNFLAMETFPSVYCKNRRRALEHTLERFHNDGYETAPFFVFGDFNFRTDTRGVVAKLSEGLNQVRVQSSKADQTRMQYQDENSQVVLSIGKKEFSHLQHQHIFTGDDGIWLKDFDRELESFSGSLFEFPITFPPSYPFEEDENGAKSYMKTRCPAWCDRVILANTATSLVNNLSDHSCVEYGIMGSGTCMGDHKPVYLKLALLTDAGTVCCCPAARGGVTYCLNGLSRSPVLDTLTLPRLTSYAHEPYTPESMDTPSPIPSPTPGDAREMHTHFNDCLTARLTANLQGEQGTLTQPSREADWTHCQSSEPALDNEPPSNLDERYSDFNANTTSLLCNNSKPLPQSPQVLVTQFAQINSDSLDLEQYFIKSLGSECFNLGLHTKGKTKMTEIPPNCLPSDSEIVDLQIESGEEKKNKNINNRVCSQEVLVGSVKEAATGKAKKTFVKCLQSRSAVEMKVSTLEKMESVCGLDPTGHGGMRTSRCLSDASWLQRGAVNNKPLSRVRLISGCESSTRLQSHHSSSDEDWFEEVTEPGGGAMAATCCPREVEEPDSGAMAATCHPREVAEPGSGAMAATCCPSCPREVEEPDSGAMAATCHPGEVAEPGSGAMAATCCPREVEEPGSGAMAATCRLREVAEPGDGAMAATCCPGKVTELGDEAMVATCHPPTCELPDVCALLHVDTDDEGPLPKGATPLLPPPPPTDPHCGDTSAAGLVAYFWEQSAALSEEDPGSEGHSNHEGGEKPGDGKCAVGCCTLL